MNKPFRLFPEQSSSVAGQVDLLYAFLVAVAVFFTALICVLILTFAIRYRRGANVRRSNSPGNMALEITWIAIPLALTMVMFFWGARLYVANHNPPPDALQVNVVGKQWMWKLQHPAGRREINRLHVPAGRPVVLRMISEDVIHSFYVPAFRVKQDVLPGRYTHLWFEPTRIGNYHLFCAEYCGTEHSQMIGEVIVQSEADYSAWLAGASGLPPEEAGARLFEQNRCDSCHPPGPGRRGPPLSGVYGRFVPLESGGRAEADEDYLRESIVNPQAKIVAGYPRFMPTFEQLSEEQILALIAYLKSISVTQDGETTVPMRNGDSRSDQ